MREDLVDRARHGDLDAFAELVDTESRRLRTIARLVLRDADLAEDAVQEALLRCWRQLPKLRDVDRFEGWLTRILIRAASDEAGRRRRFQAGVRSVRGEPTQPDGAIAVAIREQLERGFRRLSVDHRAVVVLHHYSGLTLPEISAALDVPAGTVRSRYHYAMAALRAALEADDRAAAHEEALA